ncbi:putative arginase [Aphelenchoides fujianensis]|nr:putative arginase [Aphelenchoides fujianensis]
MLSINSLLLLLVFLSIPTGGRATDSFDVFGRLECEGEPLVNAWVVFYATDRWLAEDALCAVNRTDERGDFAVRARQTRLFGLQSAGNLVFFARHSCNQTRPRCSQFAVRSEVWARRRRVAERHNLGRKDQFITFVGCANGHGGRLPGCGRAAAVLRDSEFLKRSRQASHSSSYSFCLCRIPYEWANVVSEPETDRRRLEALPEVIAVNKTLAHATKLAVQHQRELVVIGGDHSCAIGTFSGVAAGVQPRGRVGLIWIDAHLDAHTPLTSHSGNLHGMPIAHLLGHGDSALCGLFDFLPKLRPEHLVLIGARSFEQEEREFLESMNVRIFYMEEVRERGCYAVLKEAIEHTTDGTCGFTLSVDLDAFDPQDAPAIGCPETGGILADEFLRAVGRVDLRKLLATEVVEFLPVRDSPDRRTEKLVVKLIHQLYANKWGLR